jgi:hypothetical protein
MNPTPTFRFFFSDISAALSHRCTAGASVANDFSAKTLMLLLTEYSKCIGRNAARLSATRGRPDCGNQSPSCMRGSRRTAGPAGRPLCPASVLQVRQAVLYSRLEQVDGVDRLVGVMAARDGRRSRGRDWGCLFSCPRASAAGRWWRTPGTMEAVDEAMDYSFGPVFRLLVGGGGRPG